MIRNIIIAEKPSMGANIAKGLGCNKKHKGYIINDKADVIITWAFGHLISLKTPTEIDSKYKEWSLDKLPIFMDLKKHYYVSEDKVEQFNLIYSFILKAYKNGDTVNIYHAGDPDREGELIMRLIMDKISEKFKSEEKKDLSEVVKNEYRMWLKDFSKKSIIGEFDAKRPISDYDNLYQNALCRQHSDWMIGMNLSVYYTLASGTYGNVLNVGRVQSALLKIIVDKEMSIINFKEEISYKIIGVFNKKDEENKFNAEWFSDKTPDGKLKNKNIYNAVAEAIDKLEKPFIVKNKTKDTKNVSLKEAYTLTMLQVDAEKLYGYDIGLTRDITQDLYEKHKIVSYPRGDSGYLAKDDFQKLEIALSKLDGLPLYDKFLNEGKKVKANKNFVDDSKVGNHSGLYILDTDDGGLLQTINRLNEKEKNIFNLILARLLGLMAGDYIYESSEIVIENGPHKFKTKGKIIKNEGWRNYYSISNKSSNDVLLPDVDVDDEVQLSDILQKELKTKKPTRYSKGTLAESVNNLANLVKDDKELSKRIRKISPKGDRQLGLGTEGTRDSIIESLERNGFFTIGKDKKIRPTPKGIKLISIVKDSFIDPITTAEWEDQLKQIELGKYTYDKFIKSLQESIVEVISEEELIGNKEYNFQPINARSIGICPKCHVGEITEWEKNFSCSSKKCDFVIWKNFFNYTITTEDAITLLNGEVTDKVKMYSNKKKSDFSAKLYIDPKTYKVVMKF